MLAKVINNDSPILRAYGVKIGDIGEVLENDFPEKYQYKISFQHIQPCLYFFDFEIELVTTKVDTTISGSDKK